MKYSEENNNKEHILDERNFTNAINLIKELVDDDISIDIKSDDDFLRFMKNPREFTSDEKIIDKIKDLKSLLDIMGDIYHV